MRIGYLTYGLDRNPTGIARYARELLPALAAQSQHEWVLLTTEQHDSHGLWPPYERYALRGCHLLPMLLTLGQVQLGLLARQARLDLVYDPNGIAPFAGLPEAMPRVVTIHDAAPLVLPHTAARLERLRYHWHLPHQARRANAVTTMCYATRAELVQAMQLDPQRVYVGNSSVTNHFHASIPAEQHRALLNRYSITPPYVLYVGGLNPRKNLIRLMAAWASIQHHYPDTTLVVAGAAQWRSSNIATAYEQYRQHARIQLLGYVADADLPALYHGAQLLVFPSLHEGFGLPPLEAMACGTPVVASDIPVIREVLGDAAVLVDPRSVSALAAGIRRVLDDASDAAHLRQCGLAHARQYTWQRAAAQVLPVLEQAGQA
ncbi:MAG: glycosyltransferase family 4 protein [Chloroflexaceae bacterium]|nr:glycosyltransferase family 4 protein [Chloroflexaceae bacterium]